MSRYVRKTVIKAAIETPYGTPVALEPDDAILVSRAQFRIARDLVPRDLIRKYFGGSEQLIGARRAEIEFDVELAGSGAGGTAPPWGKLLRGCGMAEVITAGQRVAYNPITDNPESLTFRYFIDGALYRCVGARGTVSFKVNAYDRPMLNFRFQGFDLQASEAASNGATTYAAWKRPLLVTDANAGDVRLGCTLAGGAISGGTKLASRGLELDLGNTVSHVKLLGGESIDITARDTTGKSSVFLTAADEVAWRTDINANTLTSLGFSFGSVAGSKIAIFAPSVQRVDPQVEEYEGRALMATELRLLPSAGNDELQIIAA